ncbi:MAG: DsbA family oxidoreductase [Oxalobacteraceae bacterium]
MNPIRIDFVSDIACPWCAVGLVSLEQAIERVKDLVDVELHFQPFELNPQMGPEGEEVSDHLMRKYQISAEQVAQNQARIAARGAELGFIFNHRKRIVNTFDAHRLLHWAEIEGPAGGQHRLKRALLEAYFTRGENPADHAVLLEVVERAGLDRARAAQLLSGDEFAGEVRQREQRYLSQGINSVPAVILNDRYLVQGGQPVEMFEQALRELAEQA